MRRLALLVALLASFALLVAQEEGLDLGNALSALGAELSWDSPGGQGVLSKGGRTLSFKEGGSLALLGQSEKVDIPCPKLVDGALRFPAAFLAAAKEWFEREEASRGFSVAAIIIDPGHGGADPGATSQRSGYRRKDGLVLMEKDINLELGLDLRDRLSRAFPGKRILMTRSTDVYLRLEERTDIANSVELGKGQAIIYVSIHTNSALNKKTTGYEVWYLDPDVRRQVLDSSDVSDPSLRPILNDMLQEEFTTESIVMAQSILDGLEESLGESSPNRGIKAQDWFVVKHSHMPAVLVEVGFISNLEEARLLDDPAHLKKIKDGIYTGLVGFIRDFER